MEAGMELQIDLDFIEPNPWQPRDAEDAEHVKKVADSIEREGLMQTPVGRWHHPDGAPVPNMGEYEPTMWLALMLSTGWRMQLAFGHTRLAAFKLLRSRRTDNGYSRMPVQIRELSDEEMFRQSVSENLARKDLSPIEEAKAMRRYKDDFGKTSEEIGQLFGGLSGTAVRNRMRLLDLPEQTQELITQGSLSESIARKLLAVEKVLPEVTNVVAKELAENGITNPNTVTERIESRLREKNGVSMFSQRWSRSESKEPTGGNGLWPLSWTPAGGFDARKLKFEQFKLVYDGPETFTALIQLGGAQGPKFPETWDLKKVFEKAIFQWGKDYMRKHLTEWGAEEVLRVLDQLISPPACTACPYYMRLDGQHWCMMKACHKQKKQAWIEAELARLSAELGIPVYDKASDGAFEEANRWIEHGIYETWYNERAEHLRLRSNYSEYGTNWLTDSYCVSVVSVRQQIAEKKTEEKEKDRILKANEARVDLVIAATTRFVDEQVIPHLAAQIFGHLTHAGAFKFLASYSFEVNEIDFSDPRDPGTLEQARRQFAARRLKNSVYTSSYSEGPVLLAKKLQQLLPEWGVKISGDLVQVAKGYEPVSAETGKGDE